MISEGPRSVFAVAAAEEVGALAKYWNDLTDIYFSTTCSGSGFASGFVTNSSSAFSRLASETSSPPHLAFHLQNVALER